MNQLSEAKRVLILRCLTEGTSVRGTARITGTSKGAVLRLIAEIGPACERFHDRFTHDVNAKHLELDELWEFCFAKAKNLRPELKGVDGYGSIWTWLGTDPESKLLLSYFIGDRSLNACMNFVRDIAYRLRGKVQISSDAYGAYPAAIADNFTASLVHYGVVDKHYGPSGNDKSPETRYSPGKIRGVSKKAVIGDPDPDHVCTSHVERLNLQFRQQCKRYARLTLAHSKQIQFHRWAVAMHVWFYNWARPHSSIQKQTPAQAAGLTEYRFTLKDMLHLDMWTNEAEAA